MTWPGSRTVIRETIEGAGFDVFPVPPANVDAAGVVVVLTPPARDAERFMGGHVNTVYHQRILLLHELGEGNDEAAADAIDDAADAITDAFHGHVVLEGEANETDPVSWDDAYVDKYPPGGAIDYVQMIGTLDVGITRNVTVAP